MIDSWNVFSVVCVVYALCDWGIAGWKWAANWLTDWR